VYGNVSVPNSLHNTNNQQKIIRNDMLTKHVLRIITNRCSVGTSMVIGVRFSAIVVVNCWSKPADRTVANDSTYDNTVSIMIKTSRTTTIQI
jgi:hypothetical protein